MEYAIALFAFSAVALLVWSGLSMVFSGERQVSKRLQALTSYEVTQAVDAYPQLKPFSERVLAPAEARIRHAVAAMAPAEYRQRVRHRLALSGAPRGIDAERFMVAKVLGTFAVFALLLAILAVVTVPPLIWVACAVLGVVSFWVPDAWLSHKVEARQKQIRLALPDMLDMLTISVEAGLGFDQAVSKIIKTTGGPLGEEFARVLQEIQAGTARTEALKRMTDRTEVPELTSFVTAIIQAEQLGIPISNVLRVQASEMRLVRRQRAEERAQKIQVKIVFPMILCLLPATLIVIVGPAIISIGHVFGAW